MNNAWNNLSSFCRNMVGTIITSLAMVLIIACLVVAGCRGMDPESAAEKLPVIPIVNMSGRMPDSASSLSDDERRLAARIGMDTTLLLMLKKEGYSLRQLTGESANAHRQPINGIAMQVDETPQAVRDRVRRLAKALNPLGYQVFKFGDPFIEGKHDHIGILKSSDQWDILRCRGTSGINNSPDTIIAMLQKWDRRYGLKVIGADFDWMEAQFIHPPDDMLAFAKEVCQFCPNIVAEGVGSPESLAPIMEANNTLYLWWGEYE